MKVVRVVLLLAFVLGFHAGECQSITKLYSALRSGSMYRYNKEYNKILKSDKASFYLSWHYMLEFAEASKNFMSNKTEQNKILYINSYANAVRALTKDDLKHVETLKYYVEKHTE